MMSSGGTPNFSTTPSRSMLVSLMVLSRVTWSFTNCAMSLSLVEMRTARPWALAWLAKVPITSSASTSGTVSSGSPMARMISKVGSICLRRSSSIGGRLALYSG